MERNMNRQKIFDTFLQEVNGKGRAVERNACGGEECVYVLANHPGCAIGCQTEFKKAYKECPPKNNEMYGHVVKILSNGSDFALRLRELFEIQDKDDYQFLYDLQNFHDQSLNWILNGLWLKRDAIATFCKDHGLRVESV
jgi:hypothetical protein